MLHVDRSDRTHPVFSYSRKDALEDRAVIPAHFHVIDGSVSWLDREEEINIKSLSTIPSDQVRKGIRTALATEIGEALVRDCVSDFLDKRSTDPTAKCLILAPDQPRAKRIQSFIKDTFSVNFEIATSVESKEAMRNIKHFRTDPALLGLITVQMAYEGLDVPEITHLGVGTPIRTTPWLGQAFARATRFNPNGQPYGEQLAHIYVLSDPLMRAAIESVRSEDEELARVPDEGTREGPGGPGDDLIVPLKSAPSGTHVYDFDTGNPVVHTSAQRLMEGKSVRIRDEKNESTSNNCLKSPHGVIRLITKREKTDTLRKNIKGFVNKIASKEKKSPEDVNREIKQQFGKSRTQMTTEELERVLEYVERRYKFPVPDGSRIPF